MLNLIRKFLQNKIFYVIIIISIILMPSVSNLSAESEMRGIVTAVGVDKTEKGIEVSASIILPKSASDVNSNLHMIYSEGQSVNDAIYQMSLMIGKRLGLAHCELLVFNEKLLEEDVLKYLDYFVRTNNLTTNALFTITNNSAKDVIKAIVNGSDPHSRSVKSLIEFNDQFVFSIKMNIENFYKAYFSKQEVALVAIINTKPEGENKPEQGPTSAGSGSSSGDSGDSNISSSNEGSGNASSSNASSKEGSGGGGDSGSGGGGESSESGSGGGGEEKKKVLDNQGKIAVVKNGKLIRELTKDEILCYSLTDNYVKVNILPVSDINLTEFKNATVTFDVFDKNVKKKWFFNNGVPTMQYNIELYLKFDEINADEYNEMSLNEITSFFDERIEAQVVYAIKDKFSIAIENCKTFNTDVFAIYDKFYKFHNKEWKKFLKTLENEEDYLYHTLFELKISLKNKL